MVRLNGLQLFPEDAGAIVKSLSSSHGLAPEEASPRCIWRSIGLSMRHIQLPGCDPPARRAMLSAVRSNGGVPRKNGNAGQYAPGTVSDSEGAAFRRFGPSSVEPQPSEQAVDFLSKAEPLWTPEWSAWTAKMRPPRIAGKWLVTAHLPGHGNYAGELNVISGSANDEFTTHLKLQPVAGGPFLERDGRVVVYAGYSWRGRSRGTSSGTTPGAVPSEMHEVLWISPDASEATGRWFWGAYDEFGFDVRLIRASGTPMLISTDRPRLKTGATAQRIRILGDSLPSRVVTSDLDFGPGVTVHRVMSASSSELVVEVDVAANAVPGKRDVALGRLYFQAPRRFTTPSIPSRFCRKPPSHAWGAAVRLTPRATRSLKRSPIIAARITRLAPLTT